MNAIDRHCAAQMVIQRVVPASLWGAHLRLLFDYFADRPAGVHRSDVQHELAINQNTQTRLTGRLVVAKWLVRISTDGSDNRKHFVRTSPLAMEKKLELESALARTMRAVPAPRTAKLPLGMMTIFKALDDRGPDD